MKIKWSSLNYGQQIFIQKKQLKTTQLVQFFEDLPEVKLQGELILNAGEILDKRWKQFHSYVNRGLLSGSLSGKKISLSNGSEERKAENSKKFREMPQPIQELYKYINRNYFRVSGNIFDNFHFRNGTVRRYRTDYDGGDCKFQRLRKDLQQIVDENLVEKFKELTEQNLMPFRNGKIYN